VSKQNAVVKPLPSIVLNSHAWHDVVRDSGRDDAVMWGVEGLIEWRKIAAAFFFQV
jgi:hypothetical protein